LYNNNIEHQIHVKYPNDNHICDFYLPENNVWLEYFGLAGEHTQYDDTIKQKIRIAKKTGINLVLITQKDLYTENRIREIIHGV